MENPTDDRASPRPYQFGEKKDSGGNWMRDCGDWGSDQFWPASTRRVSARASEAVP